MATLWGSLVNDTAECLAIAEGPMRDQCFINKGYHKTPEGNYSKSTGVPLPSLGTVVGIGAAIGLGQPELLGINGGSPRTNQIPKPESQNSASPNVSASPVQLASLGSGIVPVILIGMLVVLLAGRK